MNEHTFRIGGIYRENGGNLVRLERIVPGEGRYADNKYITDSLARWRHRHGEEPVVAVYVGREGENGWRRLSNGRYPDYEDAPDYASHLIPGELDEKGNPVSAPITQGSMPKEVTNPNAGMMLRDKEALARVVPPREIPPFDPFKDWIGKPGYEVTRGTAIGTQTNGREFGNFHLPDTKPTDHLVDPTHATAAERS